MSMNEKEEYLLLSQDLITKVFNVFDPHEALRADDPRYVECNIERGSDELLDFLALTIRRSTGRTCQLLSGHRGCGKTTELFRLQYDLLTNEPRHFVVYCEVDQYIDLNDVEYTDVLLAVVQQVWTDAKKEGIQLKPGKLQSFVNDLKGILTAPVEPKDIEFEAGIAKLGFEIKKNPNNRQIVREHLRPRATTFLEAVNEIIQNAENSFKAKGYRGLVIILDNLDRVFRNLVPGTNRTSYDALFVDAGDYLHNVGCDMIYTVPPALLHSPNGAKLSGLYGTQPLVLPMIPVTTCTGDVDERGMSKLREALEKRLHFVGARLDTAFDSEQTIRRLCTASGGYMRSLMTLAQSATNRVKNLPITSAAVEQTIRRERNGRAMNIATSEQWQRLRDVAKNKLINKTEDYLQLLDNFAVLEYYDDDRWYDVNPVLREAREFNTP
jgi:hypothetical protein